MSDITVAISYTINSLVGLFTSFFNLLDSISFYGISLLDFNIAVMLISVILPIVLTLVKGNFSANSRYYKYEKRRAERGRSSSED